MKAKYKAGRPEDNLTVGKKYDVEDVRCKKGFEASEVYLKNDKQQKCWYSVELFTMYAESALPLKMGAADAALGAAALATPEQLEVEKKLHSWTARAYSRRYRGKLQRKCATKA